MRTNARAWALLATVLALIVAACSGGEDTSTPSYTVPAGIGAEIEETLDEMVQEMLSPPTATPPSQDAIGYSDPEAAIVGFWEATYRGDWAEAYASAAPHMTAQCDRDTYDQVARGLGTNSPSAVQFSDIELTVVDDSAFGAFYVYDEVGRLPIEGLLAAKVEDAWYAHIDPCGAISNALEGGPSYPTVLTTIAEVADQGDGGATTTTTIGGTTTTVATTTTTLPVENPLTPVDKAEIELVIRQFIQAEASQDWLTLHGSVPPLFSCTPGDIAAAQAPFHYSPTSVTFSGFSIEGENDEAFATFDVTYADTGEKITIEDFGAWEWGGTWYAAVEPCLYSDLLATWGASNDAAMAKLNDALTLARALYLGAGDYDIPLATLEAVEPAVSWVETAEEARVGTVAFVDNDQQLMLLTQSGSGLWYCIAEEAGASAVYASARQPGKLVDFAACQGISLANPWGPAA